MKHMNVRKRFLAGLAILAMPLGAMAQTTYYVDPTLGADGNSGTAPGAGNAFATISRALTEAALTPATQDTIELAAGIHPVAVVNVNSPVIIRGPFAGVDPRPSAPAFSTRTINPANPAARDAEAIIKATGVNNSITSMWIRLSSDNIEFDGVAIEGSRAVASSCDLVGNFPTSSPPSRTGIVMRNSFLTSRLAGVVEALNQGNDGIEIRRCNGTAGTNATIERNFIYDINNAAIKIRDNSTGVIFRDNEVGGIRTADNDSVGAVYMLEAVSAPDANILIEGNRVYNVRVHGLSVGNPQGENAATVQSFGYTVRNNHISATGRSGIVVGRDGVLIEGNEFVNTGTSGSLNRNGGVYLHFPPAGTVYTSQIIRGNSFHDISAYTFGGGIAIGTSGGGTFPTAQLIIDCNTFENITPHAINNLNAAGTYTPGPNWYGSAAGPTVDPVLPVAPQTSVSANVDPSNFSANPNATIVAIPDSLTFGPIDPNTTEERSVTILNSSSCSDFTITGVTIIGADADNFSVDVSSLPTSTTGGAFDLDFTYDPDGEVFATHTATAFIQHNSGIDVTVELNGSSDGGPCFDDQDDPFAFCQNISVCLDPITGLATITAAQIDDGSYDDCSGVTLSLDRTEFDCADATDTFDGNPPTVTLTVTDSNGNQATCEATVTVNDCDAPVITNCPGDFTTSCNTNGGFNLPYVPAVDEPCLESVVIEPSGTLSYGTTTVTVTATDYVGNEDVCTFDVTVVPDASEPLRTTSIPTEDGHVREPDMILLAEGPVTSKGSVAFIGDDAANWQTRGIFSFDTSALPDDATVTAVRLRLTRSLVSGNVAPLGNLVLDMDSPIGLNNAIDTFDYDDASAAFLDVASSFPTPTVNGESTFAEVDSAYVGEVNLTGRTQFRVRFSNTTDSDNGADYLSVHTGEAVGPLRPELIVEFYAESCFEFPPTGTPCSGPFTATVFSEAALDGGMSESHFSSGVGGSANASSGTQGIGDTAQRQQQMMLLHFDTSSIPASAIVTSAEVRLFHTSRSGTPQTTLGPLVIDIRNPYIDATSYRFGANDVVEADDFQSYAHYPAVGTLPLAGTNQYVSTTLSPSGTAVINKGGLTQMRVRFTIGDDGDILTDQATFATGNYGAGSPGRPRLVVEYYLPCPRPTLDQPGKFDSTTRR